MISQKELESYKESIATKVEKKLSLQKELINSDEENKKSIINNQIEELDEQMSELKGKISSELNQAKNSLSGNIVRGAVIQGVSGSTINVNIVNGLTELKDKLENILDEPIESNSEQTLKTQVLFICSSPTGKNPLDFGAEFRNIKDAKLKGKERDVFNIEIETGVEADELINKLTREPYPDIIHISMHSSKSEGLYFEDKNKNENPISKEELSDIFELFAEIHKPKLVILSACNSIKHAEAIKPYAENIVGTIDFLPDEVAIIYANRFYEMLFDGKEIKFAHKAALLSIKQAPFAEEDKKRLKTQLHEIPVLLT